MLRRLQCFLFLCCSFSALGQYRFIENKNQWDDRAKFRAEIPGGYLFLEEQGLSYLFYDPHSLPQHHHGHDHDHGQIAAKTDAAPQAVRGHVVKVNFLGANQQPTFQTADQTLGHYNFLLGQDQSKWGQEAHAYATITYQNLYPKVDLKFYNQEAELKYEFIVKPQGNAAAVQLDYTGQEELYVANGNLYVKTSVNAFQEAKPYCYQKIGDLELEVESAYQLNGNVLSFHFPQGYDPNYPLIIDPTLVFATFSGSTQDNWGFTAAPDDEGHLYAGGITLSGAGQFPTTSGAFQEDGTSSVDIGIIKYTPDGTAIVYATYLGGTSTDIPHSLIVNSQNQLVILGSTGSDDFPIGPNAYDRRFEGGTSRNDLGLLFGAGSDMFITVLSENGSSLIGSTYLGGSLNDGLNPSAALSNLTFNYGDEFRGDIILDDDDNIFISSVTNSVDFPTTTGAYQSSLQGTLDAVVAKFNPTVSILEWSTYLGGTDDESAYGIKLDATGQVLVTGGTTSANFPTTAGVVNPIYQGGSVDGFVTILNSTGTAIVASTFLGTNRYDQSYLIDTDEFGNIGVFGQTTGVYPVSDPSLYNITRAGQFVHKLTPDLTTTIFSTVVGSPSSFSSIAEVNIRPTAFLINACSQIYLAGWGGSTNYTGVGTNNLPVTADAQQPTTDGSDFYLMILSADAKELLYATFYGANSDRGDHVDGGTSRFDKKGVVYQAVCSCGGEFDSFPTTAGVVSNTNNSFNCNNAVFKFDLQGINADVNPTVPTDGGGFVAGDQGCAPLEVLFASDSLIGNEFVWDFGDGTTATAGREDVSHIYTIAGVYPVSVRVVDSATCQVEDIAVDTITVFAADFSISTDVTICQGDDVTLNASGGTTYNWTPATGLSDATISNPVASPSESITYNLFAVNADGCEFQEAIDITVQPLNSAFDTIWQNLCDTLPELRIVRESANTEQTYSWFLNGNSFIPDPEANFELDFDESGTYELVLQAENNGCIDADTVEFSLTYNNQAIVIDLDLAAATTICQGDTVPLFARGGVAYEWNPINTLDDPTSADPIAVPNATTDYQVRIFSDQEGCILDTNILITVIPEVKLDFGYEWGEAECGALPTVRFINNSTGTERFTWTIDGQVFDGRTPPNFIPTQEDTITVTLVGGEPLCAETASIEVPINRFGRPPNAFSPNGDGMNDTFEISGLGTGWGLMIYDRWGKLVYESKNYQGDWAGGDNGGETFYYILTSPAGGACRGYINVLRDTE